MSKFDVIVMDAPWSFSDKLEMDSVKRGAASQYKLLSNKDIVALDVKSIAEDNSVLITWVPSSLLDVGLEAMENYGFNFKQTWIWVKTKQDPFKSLKKDLKKAIKAGTDVNKVVDSFSLDKVLSFYMGRIFRQTHELCLIGTRGKVSPMLKDKSQRSVSFGAVEKHSKKPEHLQDRLDIMYPSAKKIEIFARRDRVGWTCVGNEITQPLPNEDVRDAIERLKNQ